MNAHAPLNSVSLSPRSDASIVLNDEILLYGIVDAWEVRALDVIAALAELRHLDTITVRINSPGGSVYEGLAIYDALRMSGHKIVVRVDALAGSIASIIAMAGDELVMAEDARLMIHNPWGYAQGEASDLRKLADELDGICDRLVDIYLRKAGGKIDRARLISMLDEETFLSAQEAAELGFCDRIDVPLKAAALAPDAIRNRKIDYFLTPASTENPASSSNAAQAANSGTTMTLNQSTGTAPQNGLGPLSNEAMQAAARAVAEIYNACTPLGAVGEDTNARAQDMVNRGLTVDQARAEVIGILVDRQPSPQRAYIVPGNGMKSQTADEEIRGRIRAAFHGGSIHEAMAQFCRERGISVPLSRDRLVNQIMGTGSRFMNAGNPGLHTTADFPMLLEDEGHRFLLEAYQSTQPVLKRMARKRTAVDFRPTTALRLGGFGPLKKVSEAGEIQYMTRDEEGEKLAIDEYAGIFALSRRALINDNFSAFADPLRDFAQSVSLVEGDTIAGLLTANGGQGAVLSDELPLFHASRGNIGAAAALSVESLGEARAAMRLTKGIDGVSTLNLVPAYLVVGPELETQAEALLAQINAATVDDVNPFSGKLELLVEPRITDRSWRVFASTTSSPVLAIAYLEGQEGPQLETKSGWEVLGMEFRAVLDFGAGLLGWRGAYLNPGQ
ncbi:head maturation protease, ClpP-related [Microvirga sp. P5_D2]